MIVLLEIEAASKHVVAHAAALKGFTNWFQLIFRNTNEVATHAFDRLELGFAIFPSKQTAIEFRPGGPFQG
ncbi:MAG TPA: hypothetical protein VNA15_12840 [Candidatus Angelobacter sp.]|nr:hypothetical protein [Candidatus Angelobacter sp.]